MRFFWLITCFVLLVMPVQADLITIQNPSFDDDFTAPGTFSLLTPNQWTIIDPGAIIDGNLDSVGVVLAADDDLTSGSMADGIFELRQVNFSTGPSHPQLGQNLEIRLYNRNQIESLSNPGIEVNFDNLQLDANAVPEPSSIFLLAIATIRFSIGRIRDR